MLPRKVRYSRRSFPRSQPLARRRLLWGSVSCYGGPPRAAVTVSKKTIPRAVARNRARRLVYAALLSVSKVRPLAGGIVIFPRPEILSIPFETLVAELARALE